MDNIIKYRENSIDFIKINFSMISIFNDEIFDIFGEDEQEITILDICNTTVLQNVTEVEFISAVKFKEKFGKCREKFNNKSNIIFKVIIERNSSGKIQKNFLNE